MSPLNIVPASNEIKYVKFGLPPGSKCLQPNQLSFQGRKEALAHGVVETISYGPHGRPDLQRFASNSEAKGRVLRALIHVRDDTFRSTLFGRHLQKKEKTETENHCYEEGKIEGLAWAKE